MGSCMLSNPALYIIHNVADNGRVDVAFGYKGSWTLSDKFLHALIVFLHALIYLSDAPVIYATI